MYTRYRYELQNRAMCADRILFCTHNEDEQGECRRLRVIPPLNDDCDVPDAPEDCVEFHCVIAEVCSNHTYAVAFLTVRCCTKRRGSARLRQSHAFGEVAALFSCAQTFPYRPVNVAFSPFRRIAVVQHRSSATGTQCRNMCVTGTICASRAAQAPRQSTCSK